MNHCVVWMWVWVTVNLTVSAGKTKRWYREKFSLKEEKEIEKRALLIPGVW